MPERARRRDLLDRGDGAVDGDQQLRPAGRQPLHRGAGEPVAVVDPARQVPVDVRAERAQRAHQDRGRADAVDVVVAVHGDPRGPRWPRIRRGGLASPARRRADALAGGQERARRLRLAEPAAHEHLRQHVRAAELRGQPGGGREFVGGDVQARVHDARRLGAREDGTTRSRAAHGEHDRGLSGRLLRAGRAARRRHGLDDAAVAAVRDLYSDLGIDGRVLDLGGSPAELVRRPAGRAGRLDGRPGRQAALRRRAFDDWCSSRVAASTHPADTFAEAARVLRPGGRFVCTFARRGAAAPSAAGRQRTTPAACGSCARYFSLPRRFGPAESDLRASLTGTGDRLWAVWAAKIG